MNVIAADMCTNARRVRKRWLPKIQSLLHDSLPTSSHTRRAKRGGGGAGGEAALQPFELDLRQLSASYLGLEASLYGERLEKEAATILPPRVGGGAAGRQEEEEACGEGRLQTELPPELPLSSSASSSSSSSSPQPAEPTTSHRELVDREERGAEPLEDSQ